MHFYFKCSFYIFYDVLNSEFIETLEKLAYDYSVEHCVFASS